MSGHDNSDDSEGKGQGSTKNTKLLHFPSKSEYAPVHISGLTPERTETIDLNSLFSKDVTSSGSFDLSRVGFASFGKLLQVQIPRVQPVRSGGHEGDDVPDRGVPVPGPAQQRGEERGLEIL